MNTARLALTLIAAAGLALTGCSERTYAAPHADVAEDRIAELEKQLEEANTTIANNQMSRGMTTEQVIASPASTKEASLGSGTSVENKAYAVHITIENSLLFQPGKAVLSSEAKGVLSRVIATLKARYPDHDILVVGHTDNEIITKSKDEWDDNWDLSQGRAQVVLHYLLDKGIPASRLGFAGYGQEKPRASNATEAGKSKNRRVEIIVIPKGAETIDKTDKSESKAEKADKADDKSDEPKKEKKKKKAAATDAAPEGS